MPSARIENFFDRPLRTIRAPDWWRDRFGGSLEKTAAESLSSRDGSRSWSLLLSAEMLVVGECSHDWPATARYCH
jgi:hypothetical protein